MVTRILKFLGVRAVEGIVIVLLIVFMPNIPPYANISQPYSVTPARPLEGKLALNERLNDPEILFKGLLHGPEAFASYNGELYTSLIGGDVVKITGNHLTHVVKFGKPCKGFYQEHICGRPLGLRFDKNGALYVADAYYGIYKVDVKTGKYVQLVSVDEEIANKKPKLPNSLEIASNGDIYWTDSSTQFVLHDLIFDTLSDPSGRLLHYDSKTKKNTVLIDNIQFSNGIGLAKDESFVIVAETLRNRILRYHLKGPKKGTSDVFIDGLPGMPDNIQSDGQGGFLVPLVYSVDSSNPQLMQSMGQFPLIRKFIARLLGLVELGFKLVDQVYPNEWAEKAVHLVGHFEVVPYVLPTSKRTTILHINEAGQIIDSLHGLNGKLSSISDAFVYKDALYLGSPLNHYIARVSLSKVGLQHIASPKPDAPKVPVAQTTPPPPTKAPTAKPTQTPPPKTTASQTTQSATAPPQTTPPSQTADTPKSTPPPATQPIKTHPPTQTPPKPTTPPTTTTKPQTTPGTPKETKAPAPTATTPPPKTQPPSKAAPASKTGAPETIKAPIKEKTTTVPPLTSTTGKANEGKKVESKLPDTKGNKEGNEKK